MAMTSEHFQPGGMYYGMNSSLDRYNAEMAARRARAQEFEDAQRQDALAGSAFNRNMAERAFGEGNRQFDVRMNVLRDLFARQRPQFYGSEPQMAQSGGMAMTVGSSGGGPVSNKRGFIPFGADEETGGMVNNYLARLMRA